MQSFTGSKLDRIISNYLSYIDHSELIKKRDNIIFLFNRERINEKITARKLFKNEVKPKILVMDPNTLLTNASKYNDNNLRQKIDVEFNALQKRKVNILAKYGMTVVKLLQKFLLKTDFPENLNTNNIKFLFNGKYLTLGNQIVIEEYFKGYENPKIIYIFNMNAI